MASVIKEGFLEFKWKPIIQFVRFRRVNVQRPRPPSYQKAKLIDVVKPIYPLIDKKVLTYPDPLRCKKKEEETFYKNKIENPYEVLLAKDLHNWFEKSKLIAFFHSNTYSGEERFKMEVNLKKQNMYLKVHSKTTLLMALKDTPYEPVMPLFVSHTAMVFCPEPKVSALLQLTKKMPALILMAAVVEGRLMSYSQLVEYDKLKDLTTARAQLVSILNLAQQQLVSGLTYHQNSLVYGLEQYALKDKNEEATDVLPNINEPTSSSKEQ